MKIIKGILIAIGVICLMSATGHGDYYEAAGVYYPMSELIAWTAGGFLCIGAAWMIGRRRA